MEKEESYEPNIKKVQKIEVDIKFHTQSGENTPELNEAEKTHDN